MLFLADRGALWENVDMDDKNFSEKPSENIKPLRTYEGDVEEVLKEGGGSLARIAIAESDKRGSESMLPEAEESAPQRKVVIALSLVLVFLGVGVLVTLYFFRQAEKPSVSVAKESPVILSDEVRNLDIQGLNRDEIMAALVRSFENTSATLASVVAIKIVEGKEDKARVLTAGEFLTHLEAKPPSELERSLDDKFMFGFHALSRNQPFLVLKTRYFQNTFAAMLGWERNLIDDLGPIFIRAEELAFLASLVEADFEDAIINNRDARAVRGRDGKIVLLYSFPDNETLVISTNADTLEKVGARLLASKMLQ